jgi:ubiquinone/menaquinone biosynthesis C-methylase UbiE
VLKRPVRSGVIIHRSSFFARLNAWRKRTPLNPYWLDWRKLRDSVESLAPFAKGTLLDVGVSEGPYIEIFRPVVERYIGMDYPPALLDKQPALWDILEQVGYSVDVFGDGTCLPFRTGSFDTVLCTEVLEHLPEPERCVREMARVVKPGGRLLVTVPFTQPLHELPSDFYRFTPGALEHLFERCGLEVEQVSARGNFASALGAMFSQFLLRSVGATKRQSDGSVILSRWRSTLLLPLLAVIQVAFALASRITNDSAVAQGYAGVARKPEAAILRASQPESAAS